MTQARPSVPPRRVAAPAGGREAARRVRPVDGGMDGRGLKIAVACSRFNEDVCERLLEGALDELKRRGVRPADVTLVRVPGAFELPVAARHLIRRGADAVLCLGAVIRGETAHFEWVAGESARGIARTAEETGVPVLYGVLTADTQEQALARAGGKHGNKGAEAAAGAIEMANLVRALRERDAR